MGGGGGGKREREKDYDDIGDTKPFCMREQYECELDPRGKYE